MTGIKPVYDRDGITVYHADCLDVLPTLGAGSVDAVVTDPPWGIGYKSGHNSKRRGGWSKWVRDDNFAPILGDASPFDPAPWLAFRRVALIGANCYASRLPDSRGWAVWDKTGGLDSAQTSDCELIWTNVDKPTRVFRHLWRGLIRAGAENVALQPKHHPHQKPVALMVWLMDYLGLPADALICDPYAGSGTTGVACLKSGRRCILIERDERYIPVIIKRLEAAETPLLSAIEAAPSESPCLWGDQDP